MSRVPAPFSALVPVFNEAPILEETIGRMAAALRAIGEPFEILICENGSTDASLDIARRLAGQHPEITVEHLDIADYGLALKHGVAACRHELVVIYNLDFWSAPFARDAIARLQSCDMVLGSKVMRGASDERPVVRRLITRSFNAFLRLAYGFRGTDTHGMKAVRKTPCVPIARECVTGGWVFDTEMVLRAERAGLRISEIPVKVEEVRAPSYSSIARRIPRVLAALVSLWRGLRHVPRQPARLPAEAPHASTTPNDVRDAARTT